MSKVDAVQVLSYKEMDGALEWCEDQLLEEAGISNDNLLEVEFLQHPMCDNMDEDEKQPATRRRGIYLLPNLFTTAALFAGFYAVLASMNDQFEKAAIAIFLAMILNFLMAAGTGVLIPLGLRKANVDPALASAAFVTGFTDTFGFLFFLGIATLIVSFG